MFSGIAYKANKISLLLLNLQQFFLTLMDSGKKLCNVHAIAFLSAKTVNILSKSEGETRNLLLM